MLDLIQSNILDTDIATHLRKMNDIQQMGKGIANKSATLYSVLCDTLLGGYDPANSQHHKLMCSLLMTCCDISDTCKEWETAKSIAVRCPHL